MRPRRWALVLCGSLGPLLLAFVWLETHLSRASAPASSPSPAGLPAMVLLDHTERVRTRAGRVAWQFHAAQVELLTSGDYLIRGLDRGEFLQQDQPELTFRADRARFEARTQNVTMRGAVRITSPRGLLVEAEEVVWYDAADQLVVPDVQRFEWQDPTTPERPAAVLLTERLFLSPGRKLLTMPDPVTGEQGPHTIGAKAAALELEGGRLDLTGPAKLSLMAPVSLGGSAGVRRVVLGVGETGRIGYNARTGGTVLRGKVAIELPGDRVGLSCDEALYSGGVNGTVKASGHLVLTDPDNRLTAHRVTVSPADQRAEFAGPVELVHNTPGGVPLTVRAPALTFWYATGARRATASTVQFSTGDATGSANRATVDLQAERVLLTSQVVLRHIPRAAGQAPVELRCGRLDYRFRAGGRRAVATGRPTFRQGDYTGASRRIDFEQDAELLTLEGQVRLSDGQGMKAECARLTYRTDTEVVQIESLSEAEMLISDEDIEGR